MSELFKLFNRAKIQTEEYDETPLSDLEIARIKKTTAFKVENSNIKKEEAYNFKWSRCRYACRYHSHF